MKDTTDVNVPRRTPLFRAEVMGGDTDTVFGPPLSAAPVSFSAAAIALTIIAAALVAILVFGRYTQRETVNGFIAVTDGDVRVYPQAAGTVAELLVSEGQAVSAGTPLFSLLTSRNDAMPAEANQEILQEIIAEKAALETQSSAQRQYFAKESVRLRRAMQNADRVLATLRRVQQLSSDKLEIAHRDLGRARRLHNKGHLAARDVDALSITAIDSELLVQSTWQQIAELESGRQDTELRLDELLNLQQTRLSEIAEDTSRLAQRLAVVRAGVSQTVTAPVDGQVSALHIMRGQTVLPETLALSLVPATAHYHAELFVPGRSIGLLDRLTRVDLRFSAYPFEKFGTYGATIEQVARSLLLPGDARFPVSITEPVYRVRATLDRQDVDVGGSKRPLTAGLTVEADIRLSDRSLLEWIMAPFIGVGRRF